MLETAEITLTLIAWATASVCIAIGVIGVLEKRLRHHVFKGSVREADPRPRINNKTL